MCIPDRFSLRTLDSEPGANVCGGVEYKYYLQMVSSDDTSCPIDELQVGAQGVFWASNKSSMAESEAAVLTPSQLPEDGQKIRAVVTMRPQIIFPGTSAPFVRACSAVSFMDL